MGDSPHERKTLDLRVRLRRVILISSLAGLGGVVFAQGTRTPLDGSQDALLAEVRALRAEVHQVTSAGIRTQLLVARLQLQEQRVLAAGRQLAESQNALSALRAKISAENGRVRQLEDAASRAPGQGRDAFQQAVRDASTQIEQMRQQEFQLQAREKELQKTVADEQARWTDFNNRLDALERSLPSAASP
jgi:hypothetical protein